MKKTEYVSPHEVANIRSHLTSDPKITGQEYCVLAFVSPEDRVKQRTLFEADKFFVSNLNEYIMATATHMARNINAELQKKFEVQALKLKKSANENHAVLAKELDDIRRKIQINEDEFVMECCHSHGMQAEDFLAKFDEYKSKNREILEADFNEKYGNQSSSVRGVKFCGAFARPEEAEARAEFLTNNVERGIDHFPGPSFEWLPFDPDPYSVKDARYMNKELNELMKRRKENEETKDKFFETEKAAKIEAAKKENKERLKERLKEKYSERQKKN